MIIPVTKADLVVAALRKSALASDATLTDVEPQSLQDGMADLEMMIYEWSEDEADRVIDTGYNSTPIGQQPETGEPHGVKPQFLNAVILNLAVRLMPDYRTEAMQAIAGMAIAAKANAVRMCRKRVQPARYRRRTPTGSGNRSAGVFGYHYFPDADGNRGEGDK